jgi:hypothetical protein
MGSFILSAQSFSPALYGIHFIPKFLTGSKPVVSGIEVNYTIIVKTICYCFDYTDADIIDDVLKNGGRSSIEERIREAKEGGICQCDIKNPKKR